MNKKDDKPGSCLVAWCISAHSDDEIIEQEFFHSKSFGAFDDGSLGVIKVGIGQSGSQFIGIEVFVGTLEMDSSQDLRDLAKDCLEAAEWMDENFTTPTPLHLIG